MRERLQAAAAREAQVRSEAVELAAEVAEMRERLQHACNQLHAEQVARADAERRLTVRCTCALLNPAVLMLHDSCTALCCVMAYGQAILIRCLSAAAMHASTAQVL